MLNSGKRLLSAAALFADLNGGFRNGSHHQTVLACTGCFCDFLNEGYQVIKGAGRQAVYLPKFLGIGHQLIDQYDTGPAGVKQFFEGFAARRYAFLVRFFNEVI